MAELTKGTTNVTRYVMIVDSADGSPETGVTITGLDLQYTRYGEAPAAKVDATALSTTSDVHADNKAIEVDATSSPGLHRVDWPDAAFASGAEGVLLVVTGTDFAPAVEDIQLANEAVVSTGASISVPAKDAPNGFVITWGENEANDEDSTHGLDGTTHDIEAQNDTTEKIDVYYEFNVGGDGISTGVTVHHQLDKGGGAAKDLVVYAYDWAGATWNQIGSLDSGTVLQTDEYTLFASHVGTGANSGLVRVRYATGGVAFTATTKLLVDQITVQHAIVSRTVGYADGAIWVDTNGSNTSTENFVDGTADNPVPTWAAALPLSASLGLSRFPIINGSAITLSAASDNYTLIGDNWTLDLNGQTVVGIHIHGAEVSGVMAGTGVDQSFRNCHLGAVSVINGTHFESCRLEGTQTAVEVGDIYYEDCHSGVSGVSPPIFDFGGALGNTDLHIRNYSGGLQLENMNDVGTDTLSLEGMGQLVEGTCTGGAVTVAGLFTTSGITNITLTEGARLDVDRVAEAAGRLVSSTMQASSTTTSLIAAAVDLPTDTDDIYNDLILIAFDESAGGKPNVRTVVDYVASSNTFTINEALDFTPEIGVDTFHVWYLRLTESGVLTELTKVTTGFAAANPNNLISHLKAMMSKVATLPSGLGTYAVTTDSLEALRERLDLATGTGFSTGTDSLKAIRDAIDALIAPVVAAAQGAGSSGFLADCVALVRRTTDEPSITPKYTDGDIIEYIHITLDQVLSAINIDTDHPILVRHDIAVENGTQEYVLPCNVGEIWRIARIDETSRLPVWELGPTNEFSFSGYGFTVEDNILRFGTTQVVSQTLQVLYMPNSDVSIHTATAASGTVSTIVFPATPTAGALDIREHSYAGYVIRTLSGTGAGQERVAESYDAATRTAVPRPDWTTAPDGTTVYEVLPQYSRLIKHVVVLYAALDILSNEANTQRRKEVEGQLLRKMTALRNVIGKKVNRFGTRGPGWDTNDNTDLYPSLP